MIPARNDIPSIMLEGFPSQARTFFEVPGMAVGQRWKLHQWCAERYAGATVSTWMPAIWRDAADARRAFFLVSECIAVLATLGTEHTWPGNNLNAGQIEGCRIFTATSTGLWFNPTAAGAGADLFRLRVELERLA